MSSLYEVLGVREDARLEDIKEAYKVMLLVVHPDKAGGGGGAFLAVQRAWSVLRDEGSRAAYDKELARRRLHKIHVSEVVQAGDMTFCEDDDSLWHPCRCGGGYRLAPADAEAGVSVIQCSNCSFNIEVVV
jgi:diphthamide biosynthesis protein 4